MPTITLEAEVLLNGLSDGQLSWLASLAREKLEAHDFSTDPPQEVEQRQLAMQQVKLISKIVQGQIAQEVALTEALQKTAAELDLKSVVVLPTPESGDQADSLLRRERMEALWAFSKSWSEIIGELENHLESRT